MLALARVSQNLQKILIRTHRQVVCFYYKQQIVHLEGNYHVHFVIFSHGDFTRPMPSYTKSKPTNLFTPLIMATSSMVPSQDSHMCMHHDGLNETGKSPTHATSNS